MARASLTQRIGLACVVPPLLVVALLAAAELAAAFFGDPRPRFWTRTRDWEGRALFVASAAPPVANARFRTERFPARPPQGSRRLICVGDSTCYGFPFDPPVPFACWLDLRLKKLLPQQPVEVVNLGASALCSENVLDLLTEIGVGGADVVVVYVGHNEFLDAATLPLVAPAAHAVQRLLRSSRFGWSVLSRIGATAAADGSYALPLRLGTYSIEAAAPDYETTSVELALEADGEVLLQDFALRTARAEAVPP